MEKAPTITYLTDRLINCPPVFLETPSTTSEPEGISTIALLSDLKYFILGEYISREETTKLSIPKSPENINYLLIVQICIYLLFDSFFKGKKNLSEKLNSLFYEHLFNYSRVIQAKKFIVDSERREELIRFVLYCLDFVPDGETEKYALGRLSTLDSIEREKLIKETREIQIKREKEIQKAIRKREAEEAASRMSGE
jgi:hypothetical protein